MNPTEITIIVLLIIVIGLLIFNKNGKENSDAKDDLQQAKKACIWIYRGIMLHCVSLAKIKYFSFLANRSNAKRNIVPL